RVEFLSTPVPSGVRLTHLKDAPKIAGQLSGGGEQFGFPYSGPDTALVINRLLKSGAHVTFDGPSHVLATGPSRSAMENLAKEFGITIGATTDPGPSKPPLVLHAPRVGVYQPFTSGNIDEGWTRWVLEQYGFTPVSLHNADIRDRGLRE